MKLIVGLGNPGREYLETRHNLGFWVLDSLVETFKLENLTHKFGAVYCQNTFQNQEIFFAKPVTYMNNSGKAVSTLLKGLSIEVGDLIVIHDDLDLALGRIKIKRSGGTGGHNGLKSIVAHLRTDEFLRIRIGIGRPEDKSDVVDFVLSPFQKEEQELANKSVTKAIEAIVLILEGNLIKALSTVY
ncbi:MAG: aminoacyl-tRNA hydrolase [bacterium]